MSNSLKNLKPGQKQALVLIVLSYVMHLATAGGASPSTMWLSFIFVLCLGGSLLSNKGSLPRAVDGFFRHLDFARAFSLMLALSAFLFVRALIDRPHEALAVPNAFIFVMGLHIVLLAPFLIKAARTLRDRRVLAAAAGGYFLAGPYFRSMKTDLLSRFVAIAVGVPYLIFFYLTVMVFVTPGWTTQTTGEVMIMQQARSGGMMSLMGGDTSSYCVLHVRKADGSGVNLSLSQCPDCITRQNRRVTVTHHAFDYFHRRAASAECVE